jgi:iron complex outermembrane receptor protein
MTRIKRAIYLILLLLFPLSTFCQAPVSSTFSLTVVNQKREPINAATVKLLQDNKLVITKVTNINGEALFGTYAKGSYTFLITHTGYKPQTTRVYNLPGNITNDTIRLQPDNVLLQEVSVASQAPLLQHKQGKTIVDVAASVTNTGLSVLDVLEKTPGVSVDRNGGISMQGKAGILVMIDDKPTYLSGTDLSDMLNSINSAQVAQIELITNPGARYDAAGNAGIINIKTKKNKQVGFNGAFTASAGQGAYPKTNDNLLLNYRVGKINTFLNYSFTGQQYLTNLYALRKYYTGNNITAILDQPSYFTGTLFNNTVKTGIDYDISPKTTIGVVLSGTITRRKGSNTATATWMQPTGAIDSAILTINNNNSRFNNRLISVNARHNISANQDISADIDWLHYNISSELDFKNHLLVAGGYNELTQASIPTGINIVSGKADYTLKSKQGDTFEAGVKSSYSSTDNTAAYQNFDGTKYLPDNTRSNHFIYDERISATYASYEKKMGKFNMQAGLRYEATSYHAHQLGNSVQKDTAFSRNYGNLFPSGYISYQANKSNGFTLTAGRRIERPAFQTLNPFYFIINKYTYQTGNAYILPQYTLNFELSHQYKDVLTTAISYNRIQNYFSQIFLSDANNGILLYTQGNVGHTTNLAASSTLAISPAKWWSLTAQAVYNHKQLRGFNGNSYTSTIDQLNINTNNQFNFAKKYTAEISGFYTTRARNDIQELLYPTGQVSLGVGKQVMNKKGTLRLSARDIFYTNAMEGLTQFPNATEYFILKRDSRVVTLSFTYRFGKAYKTTKRTDNSAADEIQRVGNG